MMGDPLEVMGDPWVQVWGQESSCTGTRVSGNGHRSEMLLVQKTRLLLFNRGEQSCPPTKMYSHLLSQKGSAGDGLGLGLLLP